MESNANVVMNTPGLRVTAKTPAGAAYVKKVTHPPTTTPDEYGGIPDSSAPNVVLMEVKGEINFPPILTTAVDSVTTTTTNPTRMMFLSPSGGKVGSYCFLWNALPAGGAPPGWVQPLTQPAAAGLIPAINNVCPSSAINSGYNWKNWLQDVGQSRTAYKSETYYLNATAFNNQGTVTCAKFKPNVLYGLSFTELVAHTRGCKKSIHNLVTMMLCLISNLCRDKKYRQLAFERLHRKGVKKVDEYGYDVVQPNELTLNDLKGYPTEYTFQCLEIDVPSGTGSLTPLPNSSMWTFSGLLPDNPSQLLNLSSKAATRPAFEGSFVVHQKVNPISEWTTTGDGSQNVAPVEAYSGPLISILRTRDGTVFSYMPLYSDNVFENLGETAYAHAGDTPWNNLDWSITMFDGLTVPTVLGTTLSSVPYITIKSFAGLELQPNFQGSLLPFARLLPPPDCDAMEIATTIFHGRPDDLPASANDFGTIASLAVKYLPTAVSFLKNLFSGGGSSSAAAVKKPKLRAVKNKKSKPENAQIRKLSEQVRQLTMGNSFMRPPALPTYVASSQVAPVRRNRPRVTQTAYTNAVRRRATEVTATPYQTNGTIQQMAKPMPLPQRARRVRPASY